KCWRDEMEALDDLVSEPRVRARVEGECGKVVLVVVDDLPDAITYVAPAVALECLPFAQHLARDGIQRIVIHAHERPPQQVDSIQHETAWNGRLTAAEVAFRFTNADRPRIAPEIERMAQARSDALQNCEIEVDRVPAGQHVGVELSDSIAERIQRG